MDIARFDALTRALGGTRSRRALALFLSGVTLAGPRSMLGASDVAAKRGKRKKGKKKKAAGARPAPPPSPPTCGDGIRNGDETDVDCGGSCATKCTDGKACGGDLDCQSGHCISSVCRECGTAAHCGAGRDCVGNRCCTVDGFGSDGVCATDDECCSGNCVTYQQQFRTCRPAGCIPPGGSCAGGSSACCSFTCSGAVCS